MKTFYQFAKPKKGLVLQARNLKLLDVVCLNGIEGLKLRPLSSEKLFESIFKW